MGKLCYIFIHIYILNIGCTWLCPGLPWSTLPQTAWKVGTITVDGFHFPGSYLRGCPEGLKDVVWKPEGPPVRNWGPEGIKIIFGLPPASLGMDDYMNTHDEP